MLPFDITQHSFLSYFLKLAFVGLNNNASAQRSLSTIASGIQPIHIHFDAYKRRNMVKTVSGTSATCFCGRSDSIMLTNLPRATDPSNRKVEEADCWRRREGV